MAVCVVVVRIQTYALTGRQISTPSRYHDCLCDPRFLNFSWSMQTCSIEKVMSTNIFLLIGVNVMVNFKTETKCFKKFLLFISRFNPPTKDGKLTRQSLEVCVKLQFAHLAKQNYRKGHKTSTTERN